MTAPDRLRAAAARAMRAALLTLSRRRWLGRLATRLPLSRQVVGRFIAGQSLDEALTVLEVVHASGLLTTIDVLGEAVSSPEHARAAADRYLATLDALSARGLDGNVSLKLSQMGLDVDPALCRQNVAHIFARAAETGAFVRIDMEDHTKVDATLALWRDLRGRNPNSGVVIQAMLRRSESDIDRLVAEGARVRLCKGAYQEPPAVAFQEKAEVDASYARLMERLLLDGEYPALATHDVRLIRTAVEVARRAGVDRDRFEFQMLYGVRRDLQQQLIDAGYRVRLYVPYGSEWYPYYMRRLAERPANVAFIVGSLMREAERATRVRIGSGVRGGRSGRR